MATRDQDLISDIYSDFTASGRTYRALIRAIATHPEFLLVEVAP